MNSSNKTSCLFFTLSIFKFHGSFSLPWSFLFICISHTFLFSIVFLETLWCEKFGNKKNFWYLFCACIKKLIELSKCNNRTSRVKQPSHFSVLQNAFLVQLAWFSIRRWICSSDWLSLHALIFFSHSECRVPSYACKVLAFHKHEKGCIRVSLTPCGGETQFAAKLVIDIVPHRFQIQMRRMWC